MTAYLASYWRRSSTARKNWQRVGFTDQLDRSDLAVVFTRQGQQR